MSVRRPGPRRRPTRPEVLALESRRLLAASAVDEFPIPSAQADPVSIVSGPDGNLWFAEFRGKIGRITTAGVLDEFTPATPAGGVAPRPEGLISGPGGDLWYFDEANKAIGRITTAGRSTELAVEGLNYDSGSLTLGSDGNLWFTFDVAYAPTGVAGEVGRLTPDGTLAVFALPDIGDDATDLVAGPDGNIRYLDVADGKVGSITPAGVVTEIAAPAPSGGLTVGPDGDLWYVSYDKAGGESIVRLGPDGRSASFPVDLVAPYALAAGPDGGVYFAGGDQQYASILGRIGHDGVITATPIAGGSTRRADALASGPDGNLWFVESDAAVIGRLDLAAGTTSPPPTLVGDDLDPLAPAGEPATLAPASIRSGRGVVATSATIDWGDGTAATVGTFTTTTHPLAGDETFSDATVSGTHTYAATGTYHVTVTVVADLPDGSRTTLSIAASTTAVDPSAVATPAPEVVAGAGYAFAGSDVGYFQPPTPHDPATLGYTATIDWGDGTAPTPGTVVDNVNPWDPVTQYVIAQGPGDPLAVSGGHTFAKPGDHAIRVTLTDAYGHSSTATTPARVVAGPIEFDPIPTTVRTVTPSPPIFTFLPDGTIALGEVHDFRGEDASAGDTVTVDWGDGTAPTAGSLSPPDVVRPLLGDGPGPPSTPAAPSLSDDREASGRHIYARDGTYSATVTVADADGHSTSGVTAITVTGDEPPPGLQPRGAADTVAPGESVAGLGLGSFTTLDNTRTAGDFTASVDWGDGTPATPATVAPDPDNQADLNRVAFDLSGDHTFASPGVYRATVHVVESDGTTLDVPVAYTVRVASVLNLDPYGLYYIGTADESPGGPDDPITLADFTTAEANASAGDFTATIDWGDGSAPTPGTIQARPSGPGGNPGFVVSGFHSYAEDGTYTILVAIEGLDGKVVSATRTAAIGATAIPVFVPAFPVSVGAPGPITLPDPVIVTEPIGTPDPITVGDPVEASPTIPPAPVYVNFASGPYASPIPLTISTGVDLPAGPSKRAHHPAKHHPTTPAKHHKPAHHVAKPKHHAAKLG